MSAYNMPGNSSDVLGVLSVVINSPALPQVLLSTLFQSWGIRTQHHNLPKVSKPLVTKAGLESGHQAPEPVPIGAANCTGKPWGRAAQQKVFKGRIKMTGWFKATAPREGRQDGGCLQGRKEPLAGMTERVADQQTEEGSPPGVLRDHEFSVEHPERGVVGHVSTLCICRQKDMQTWRWRAIKGRRETWQSPWRGCQRGPEVGGNDQGQRSKVW